MAAVSRHDPPAQISGILQPVEITLPTMGEPWRGRIQMVRLPYGDGISATVELISEGEFQRRLAEMNAAA